ncbi:MAG: 2,4-dienoyl-CoA reductase (NADPH2) [Candidatus Magnetoglobus multicellularis str. Araruama]|uniref:2,4-dienoyl-CoA reductase (NADPH2) n=1 Tax=Candidatus Magnetoglobus multicellularis str. Araruama TaxID=890399 RepID=A0A1V1PAA7_9BACT|nr:MAG: 2,4-dienoyl-CoA reductase (NADPH2) [Candidatus Magnetoglobus multicellularis str. Araruama]
MPAMHLNMAADFMVTDRLVEFYAERARGGAAMISVGYATVDDMSGNTMNIGAHSDDHIPGLKQLSHAIQSNGALSVVQLNHAGRYNFSFFLDGKTPVAPSAIASRMTRETPRELSIDEIKEIIHSFAMAANRVKQAGFDAVEVLSGTGYLISQFLSPLTNHREDEYGGNLESRMRFGLEVMQAIKSKTGSDYPLIVRMNGNEFMKEGSSTQDLIKYASALVNGGVDAICVNVGWHEARVPQIVSEVPRGMYGYLARRIKDATDVPVIASHRINDPEIAREMIADSICDMVALGRSLIADPYFPKKAESHREKEIVHCIACAQGCFDNLFKLKSVECLCNPMAGYEKERAITKAQTSKKVMIIGGGAAGMSAAIAAHDRGHKVTLFESASQLGGQLLLAGAPPGREEFCVLAQDLANQVTVRKISVALSKPVDMATVSSCAPDHIVLATGAAPISLPVPGIDMGHVVQAWDVLAGRVHTGKNVVIIGGGAVGVETALLLSEKGTLSGDAVKFLLLNQAEPVNDIIHMASFGTKKITIIEMLEKVGKDIGKSTRWSMLQDIGRRNIEIKVNTKAVAISEKSIRVSSGDQEIDIPADTIVLAVGAKSYQPLKDDIESKQIPCDIVGDALSIGKAFDAVHQGFTIGREI